jgi:hypothetical protein
MKCPSTTTKKGLFNGNIAVMLSEIAPSLSGTGFRASPPLNGNAYQHDQLNRIKSASDYQWDSGTESWDDVNTAFRTSYTYYSNGNIETLTRNGLHGTASALLDDLTYHNDVANGRDNRLLWVEDAQGAPVISGVDLGTQSAGKYGYDAIGNLTWDMSAEITAINWTVQGKVSSIGRLGTSSEKALQFQSDAFGNRTTKRTYAQIDEGNPNKHTTTFYVRDAQGNVLATYLKTPKSTGSGFNFNLEFSIYGSSRVGLRTVMNYLEPEGDDATYQDIKGSVAYELTNHPGNVLVTLKDLKKLATEGDYVAEVSSAQDYCPFGMVMPGRNASMGEGYRWGFQGEERDDEVKGGGNSVNFKQSECLTKQGRL